MDRQSYLQTFSAADRSEAAARFDHQLEYDALSRTAPCSRELDVARARLLEMAFWQAVDNENLPYRQSALQSGRQLPEHLQIAMARLRDTIAVPDEASVLREALAVRNDRMEYLAKRYGCCGARR